MLKPIVTSPRMHCKHPFKIFSLGFILCLSVVLGACAPRQTPLPAETSGTQQVDDTAIEVTTHGLDEEQSIESLGNPMLANITDPWQLVDLARDKPIDERNILLLRATGFFLDQQHFSTAFSTLDQIDTASLDQEQQIHHALLTARYTLLSGDVEGADSMQRQIISGGTMNQNNYRRLLKLDIAIATQQQDLKRAITSRINLGPFLEEAEQLDNQQQLLSTLTHEADLFRSADSYTQDDILRGWLELASLQRNQQFDDAQIAVWQQRYPNHPALVDALNASLSNGPISSNQIALLLPLTSRLGRAAEAFKAGFDAALRKDGRFNTSRVYDFGSEAELINFYYQSAVNDGADFIIGPLGRSSVQSLLQHLSEAPSNDASTMVLGELTPEHNTIPNIWGFSLSPEQDAVAIAERAINLGLRQALVMEKNNAWGARVSAAFTSAFEAAGGQVVGSQRFHPNQADHSAEVKNLLNINASAVRHSRLEQMLGTNLQFSVRRRDDIDFIFLAGNNKDARRILPLVKFYRAHKLPVYATSSVSGQKFNKLMDEDLKGLRFADLPWLLNSLTRGNTAANTANSNVFPRLPYSNSTLNRLYALGYAAFEVIPQLTDLQADKYYQFETPMMSLSMDDNRNLQHSVAWGRYTANSITRSP